jgi:hypothetical protein
MSARPRGTGPRGQRLSPLFPDPLPSTDIRISLPPPSPDATIVVAGHPPDYDRSRPAEESLAGERFHDEWLVPTLSSLGRVLPTIEI